MSKMKRLPALAVIAIIIGSVAVLSGSAYAAYQLLWPAPSVHVSAPTKTDGGRDEVVISLKQCGDDSRASRYELKKNAAITADQVAGVIKARCELDAIGTWAKKEYPSSQPTMNYTKEYDTTDMRDSMVTHIAARSSNSITFVGLTKYNEVDKTLAVLPTTRFIADGHEVTPDAIGANDPVIYYTTVVTHVTPSAGCTPQHCGGIGNLVSEKLQAVVKLSQPFENYDQFAWQSLTEIVTCSGNPNDRCLTGFASAIELYQGSGAPDQTTQMKQIQGKVTSLDGTSFTMRSSSGTLFTITAPTDIVASYNTNRAARYYNNQLVKIGSGIDVLYNEHPDQHSKSISSKSISSVTLQTELVGKSDTPAAY